MSYGAAARSPSVSQPLNRYDALALLATSVAALALRLWGLGSESIWLDEATSIILAKMSIPEIVRWTAVDIHPPLYYAALHVWLALGDGEVQVRLLSVLFGAASVAVLYLLAQRLFNRWVGVSAAALLATSPLHVWYSQEARMYAMLALLTLLSSYFMVRALLDGHRAAWVLYAICAALSFYTHYYAFFVALFQNVFALYLVWRGHIPRPAYGRWVAVQIAVALAFLPWLPVLANQVRGGGGSWVARSGVPGPGALADTAVSFTLGPDVRIYPALVRRLVYASFGLLFLAGILSWLRRRGSIGVPFSLTYLLVSLAGAWLASQVKPLYSLRYLLPFLPAYYILIGQGLSIALPAHTRPRNGRVLLWAALLAGLLALGCFGVAGSAAKQQEADWRSVTAHVIERSQPDDVVVFVPGWNAKPFDYYARGRLTLEADTPIPIIAADAPALAAAAARSKARLWLVQAEGHYADPTNILRDYLDRTYESIERQRYADGLVVSLYRLAQ